MAQPSHITVFGGGPAGLAAAAAANDAGFDVTLFEANDTVGGNCRTFSWSDAAAPSPMGGFTT